MDKTETEIPCVEMQIIERRNFLVTGVLTITTLVLGSLSCRIALAATKHRYNLAPDSILPPDIRQAPVDVREAYRFAIANRDTLRYIPCYCGCGEQGHTSNASCYFQDSSTPENPVFDRMSLG
jgi:uncharacterized protein with PCYCGC motif